MQILYDRGGPDRHAIFFLTPGCGTCFEVATELSRQPSLVEDSTFMVVGSTATDAAAEMREILSRAPALLVTGDEARTAMRALNIHSIPFAVRITDGRISQKMFLRYTSSLRDLFPSELPTTPGRST